MKTASAATSLFRRLLATGALVAWTASASATGFPWRNHVAPFEFLFGNEIDTHQQSHQVGGDRRIQGLLYIHYTGEIIDGIPVAEHTDCSAMPEARVAGWSFNGVRAEGTFIAHDARPLFCASMPKRWAAGAATAIFTGLATRGWTWGWSPARPTTAT